MAPPQSKLLDPPLTVRKNTYVLLERLCHYFHLVPIRCTCLYQMSTVECCTLSRNRVLSSEMSSLGLKCMSLCVVWSFLSLVVFFRLVKERIHNQHGIDCYSAFKFLLLVLKSSMIEIRDSPFSCATLRL